MGERFSVRIGFNVTAIFRMTEAGKPAMSIANAKSKRVRPL
jgi:hypothetical protein